MNRAERMLGNHITAVHPNRRGLSGQRGSGPVMIDLSVGSATQPPTEDRLKALVEEIRGLGRLPAPRKHR